MTASPDHRDTVLQRARPPESLFSLAITRISNGYQR
jgi:hypothetical protein